MPMTEDQLGRLAGDLIAAHCAEAPRLDRIAAAMANATDIFVPAEATRTYRQLVDQARFNVLPLVATAVAQNLFVDGYRPTVAGRVAGQDNAPIWDAVWQPNRLDARQAGIYRPAVVFGTAYAVVVPGDVAPVVTPMSPRRCTTLWDDPSNDEWPTAAMTVHRGRVTSTSGRAATGTDPLAAARPAAGAADITIWDDEFRYPARWEHGKLATLGAAERHGLGVVPIVRFVDRFDGEPPTGKIEPLLHVQRQLNQTTFGLLMAQQYGAFRQRWAVGMAIDEDAQGNPIRPFNPGADMVWQNESPDGRFGDFAETNLGGYLDARDKLLLHVASVAQIPPHNLLVGGGISNISAEALTAIEAGHRQDIGAHQTSFGESIEQMLRLAARAVGDTVAAADTSAQVIWRDTTPRSMAQIADALGKLASQLGVPPQALWDRIPGVTDQDLARWRALAAETDLMDELRSIVTSPPPPTDARPPSDSPDSPAPA